MVGFSSGHRAIYKDHLLSLDVSFRKLCRSIAAPPSNTDRSLEWHDGYHNWNSRVQDLPSAATVKTWSGIVCKQHWDLCCYVGCLPEHRWVQRVLAWNPVIWSRQAGRPRHMWDHKVAAFCRCKRLGTLAGLRTGLGSMVGTPWLVLHLLHFNFILSFAVFYFYHTCIYKKIVWIYVKSEGIRFDRNTVSNVHTYWLKNNERELLHNRPTQDM